MKNLLYAMLLMTMVLSCKEENVFELSPAKRTEMQIEKLKKELTDAPNGWILSYFPKADSLMYTNPDELISNYDLQNKFGYGGHCFALTFHNDGSVETSADFDELSLTKTIKSEYEIGLNSSTQLSFTTYSYIHKLVNERFGGSADLLYVRKDRRGNLLFRSASYIEPAREFIYLSRVNEGEDRNAILRASYDNAQFFKNMKKPRLNIRKGDKILFRSDMKKSYYRGDAEDRYHLFLFAKELPLLPGDAPEKKTGLGSGYTGTAEGLLFYPGLRYSSKYIFYDFIRTDDRFECELVEAYDPYNKTLYITSRHLAPDGMPLGVIAEIFDDDSINL